MSCNANPRYTAYWPTVAAAWLKLDITPVCLFIPDDPTHKLPEAPGGIVHVIPHLKDVHIIIQTYMVRFWASCLYPKAIVTATDIDLVPLSTHFFNTQLVPYPEDAYLHLKLPSGGYDFNHLANIQEDIAHIKEMRWLGALWHIAKGEVMHKVLEFSQNWEASCRKTLPYFLQKDAKETDLKVVGRRPFTAFNPSLGDDIYPSIRLHHTNYLPVHYISHQPDQYAHVIDEMILTCADPNLNIKQHDHIGIHFHLYTYAECKESIEHLLTYGTVPRPSILLRYYTALWRWLIEFQKCPKNQNATYRAWLDLILNGLMWSTLRLISLFKPIRPYNKALLAILYHKRNALLAQHPQLASFFIHLLRIKNASRS